MKRTGFASKAPQRQPATQCTYSPRPRAQAVVVAGPARLVVQAPKAGQLQHAGYMDAVRGLRCYRCHRPPRSQFCHADAGKGTGIKSDCREGWPGCWECHDAIGTARVLPKAERREWEAEAGRATRAEIRSMGLWPVTMPAWPDDETT